MISGQQRMATCVATHQRRSDNRDLEQLKDGQFVPAAAVLVELRIA